MLWIAWISQHPHNLGRKSKHGPIQICIPSQSRKKGCGDHFCAHIPISTMSNHSLYLWREIGRVEMLWNGWISLYRLYLGMKCRGHAPKFSSPVTQKPGCDDGCGGWIQSPPSPTIHYTYNDILEWLRCCELPESVSTHTIWVRKVSTAPSQICTLSELEIGK